MIGYFFLVLCLPIPFAMVMSNGSRGSWRNSVCAGSPAKIVRGAIRGWNARYRVDPWLASQATFTLPTEEHGGYVL